MIMKKLEAHSITGTIHLLSPTRIGGSDDQLEIGGTDLTCIKDVVSGKPYIPGSSLKGKMRSELEQRHGLADGGEPFLCKKQKPGGGWDSMKRTELKPEQYLLGVLFGPHKNTDHDLGPTRIIVRDARCTTECVEIERKASTAMDRVTGSARRGSLRTEERVAAGTEFELKIVIQVWDLDREAPNCTHKDKKADEAMIEFVKEGLLYVQQTGLGSGISKGSGEIEFRDLKLDGQPFTL